MSGSTSVDTGFWLIGGFAVADLTVVVLLTRGFDDWKRPRRSRRPPILGQKVKGVQMYFWYDVALHKEIVFVEQFVSLSGMHMYSKCDGGRTGTMCCVELFQPPGFM